MLERDEMQREFSARIPAPRRQLLEARQSRVRVQHGPNDRIGEHQPPRAPVDLPRLFVWLQSDRVAFVGGQRRIRLTRE